MPTVVTKGHERHAGKSVGSGHCVALLQAAGAPHTSRWRKGVPARGSNLAPGTLIATFDAGGRYANSMQNSHAAILIAENEDGLLVWDQWLGRPVQQRVIQFRGGKGSSPVNDGDAFHAIEFEVA